MSEQLMISRTIAAEPETIFAVLADPAKHVELDGSGMIRGVVEGGPVTANGQFFVMDMNNGLLGDYRMKNAIITYVPNREIGWAPQLFPHDGYTEILGEIRAGGHTFIWRLEPDGSGATNVSLTYDWSQVADKRFKAFCPVVSEEQLQDSVERLAKAVA